ncbi:MAG: leucyl aminopeptidase family protein [Gammaproteobacteria bacterium]|jgi:leucyl aminopeptidase
MSDILPDLAKPEIKQSLTLPSEARINSLDHLLVVLPESDPARHLRNLPFADWLASATTRQRRDGKEFSFTGTLPNNRGTGVCITTVKGDVQNFALLEKARKLAADVQARSSASVGIVVLGFAADAARIHEAITAALLAAAFRLPSYKRKPEPSRLRMIQLLGLERRLNIARVEAEADGNNLARWLTMLPTNRLTPGAYRKAAEKLARQEGWRTQFMDERELKRRKAGAFLAVSQGSNNRDAGILHLRYTPARQSRGKSVALVGKGICFDTGGTNLKGAKGMFGMHGDMQGSAVALGTLLALSRMKVDFPVDCWLALAVNDIGPSSFKPNDVVTASNGTTIEVVHTDAEGRMVLADTLAIAARAKPALIMDYATLTGACVFSLGSRYSGVFTNRDHLRDVLIEGGRQSGERVWPFPVDEDYDQRLESTIADVKQCTIDSEADHILAARFLGRFAGEQSAWVHTDLSASECKGGLAHIPSEVTGFGVRLTVNLLLDQQLVKQA